MRGFVLGKVFALWSRVVANRSYRPERHYMRRPGPKTLAMIGRRYRAETAEETREPLPERWLAHEGPPDPPAVAEYDPIRLSGPHDATASREHSRPSGQR